MAKMWEPQTIKTYQDWIETIITQASDDLNDWENSFIDSLFNRLEQGDNLSERQAEILERIYSEKTK